ncbi:GNAT family N-acetyltransferase [Williamsia sp. MIQD14]|uniref:GNAT family N-acetyltransferase n=1 Tax=Williamsia sp. MIQD14 TaxID=3425703 RepID=UPI003DA0CC7C
MTPVEVSSRSSFTFRPVTRADFPLVARWLATPDVARWWNQDHDPASLEKQFGPVIDGETPAEDLVVEGDGEPIGLLQRCRIADFPDYVDELEPVIGPVGPTTFTIDYLIGVPGLLGRGIGPAVIAAACADTFARNPDADRILVPVVAANRRSWRALDKAGFRIVASGEMTPDNPIDDRRHHVLALDRPAVGAR